MLNLIMKWKGKTMFQYHFWRINSPSCTISFNCLEGMDGQKSCWQEPSGDANVERIFHWERKAYCFCLGLDLGLALLEGRLLRPVIRKWVMQRYLAGQVLWGQQIPSCNALCPPHALPLPQPGGEAELRSHLEYERRTKKFPLVLPWEHIPVHVCLFPALLHEGQTSSTESGAWGVATRCWTHQASLALAKQRQHLAVNDSEVAPWFLNATSTSLCTARLHLPQSGTG